jgi:hypothetical protein
MEDVAVLCNYIHRIFTKENPDYDTVKTALKEYSDLRQARVKRIVKISSLFAKLHTGKLWYPLGPALRTFYYRYMPDWAWAISFRAIYTYQPIIKAVSLSPEHFYQVTKLILNQLPENGPEIRAKGVPKAAYIALALAIAVPLLGYYVQLSGLSQSLHIMLFNTVK